MSSPLFSILLMGILPVWGGPGEGQRTIDAVRVAPPLPVVADMPEGISASGLLIVDLHSGQRLLAQQAEVPLPMASLTKIMTALLIVEHHDLAEWVTIPPQIEGIQGEIAHLPPGHQFTVGDLLTALLVGSANDAAVTLALHHSGSIGAFVGKMNERAKELGLRQTSYQNPVGFDAEGQWSSPQDLAWLTMFALRHEDIRRRMGLRGAILRSRTGEQRTVTHTHALLHAESGVIGGKTGTTPRAKQCLLSIVRGRDDREYLVILLHSANRYGDMRVIVQALTS